MLIKTHYKHKKQYCLFSLNDIYVMFFNILIDKLA